jgi:hypothetical protein
MENKNERLEEYFVDLITSVGVSFHFVKRRFLDAPSENRFDPICSSCYPKHLEENRGNSIDDVAPAINFVDHEVYCSECGVHIEPNYDEKSPAIPYKWMVEQWQSFQGINE